MGCIAAVVIETWADCIAGPLLEVMDKLGLGYPQGMFLFTVIDLAAGVTRRCSRASVFICSWADFVALGAQAYIVLPEGSSY